MICLDFLYHTSYADRKVRKITGYGDYNGSSGSFATLLRTMEDIDFNPNDSIEAQVILETSGFAALTQEPNYMIVRDKQPASGGSYSHTIVSRWYVMEIKRLRGGQYRVNLRRDVIAEDWDNIKNEPCFIERGWVHSSDPLIFNDEGGSYNQIKYKETALKDKTDCPWIVAYVAKYDGEGNPVNLSGNINRVGTPDVVLDYEIEDSEFATVANIGYPKDNYKLEDVWNTTPGWIAKEATVDNYYFIGADNTYRYLDYWTVGTLTPSIKFSTYYTPTDYRYMAIGLTEAAGSYNTNAYKQAAFPYATVNQATIDYYKARNGWIIKDDSNKYYKFTFEEIPWASKQLSLVRTSSDIMTAVKANYEYRKTLGYLVDIPGLTENWPNNVQLIGNISNYVGILTDITVQFLNGELVQASYDLTGHINTEDAPYNIICTPYADGEVINFNSAGQYIAKIGNMDKSLALAFASNIAQNSLVYDIQMLPYCPIKDLFRPDVVLFELGVPNKYSSTINYTFINKGSSLPDGNLHPIFNVQLSSFSFTINNNSIKEDVEIDPVERKVKTLTKFSRLCSPNYSGVFQFNKQKNDGLRYIEVNCTYKPFSPYIHLNPDFGGLYGTDYDDNRGLICQGDFSLPIVRNNWEEYQIQNKNFLNLFNRQIDHLEVEYDIQNKLAGINVFAGALLGAGAGAGMGMLLSGGNPIGAAVGGVLGAAGSAVSGIADVQFQKKLQNENLSYTKDTFNMQLDNIKAQPNSLTRVSSFDIDNKIFPFMEDYVATYREENALRDKLTYMSMNVGLIGNLKDYVNSSADNTFIQGQIIFTNTNTSFDTHMSNEIYQELAKGVRIIT